MRRHLPSWFALVLLVGCGPNVSSGTDGGDPPRCDLCVGATYTPCDADGNPGTPVDCDQACAAGLGCVECVPNTHECDGNDVLVCGNDGAWDPTPVETCDPAAGMACLNGACADACTVAAEQPSNVGCEFWAVDLDQQDAINDPASAPWGLVLSNVGGADALVTIEINNAAPGQPEQLSTAWTGSVPAGSLQQLTLPTRELDCGTRPNDYNSPGTCLSSRAFRVTSTRPIVAYQFNVFENAYSNDASLLLPTNALGTQYRVIGWLAGHPVKIPPFNILDRSYVTIVGTAANTQVKVRPSWRIKGNPPVAATAADGTITVTLGEFDVLNLETDDGTFSDDMTTVADLSGSLVQATKPVAVFSGVESTGAPAGVVDIPTGPSWTSGDTCCLDHLEDQMFPMTSVGTHYVITRSPIRSTGSYHEPDILRFVGVAETAQVTTSLPSPFDSFTLQPGEVKTTWAQDDIVVTSDKPVMVGQLQISNEYVDGPYIGDPSLTVFPPVEQFRQDYLFLTPGSWTQNWVVVAAPVGAAITLDGASTASCITAPAGSLDAVAYEARRCAVAQGVHTLTGDQPFGIIAYGYGSAGSYAFAGGADVKPVYTPPPID